MHGGCSQPACAVFRNQRQDFARCAYTCPRKGRRFDVSHETELKISALGLDTTEHRMLDVVLGLLRDEGVPCTLLAANDPSGHLVIVDREAAEAEQWLTRLAPGQVKLVLGGVPVQGRNLAFLAKPFNVGALRDMLMRIVRPMREQLQAAPKRQDTDAGPSSVLLDALREARETGQALCVQRHGQPLVYVCGAARACAFVPGHDAESLLTLREPLAFHPLDDLAYRQATQGLAVSALDALIWQCALQNESEGLPRGLEEDTPVRLKAWPNFTRQGFRNDFFRIAAVLARQPASCAELVKTTGLPRASVAGFLLACDAVGLLVAGLPAGADPDKVTPLRRKTPPARQGLLARLAERLGWRRA